MKPSAKYANESLRSCKCHEELKKAYQISQDFKQWYDIGNRIKTTAQITGNLHQGYQRQGIFLLSDEEIFFLAPQFNI
jgi:hypothetical protein